MPEFVAVIGASAGGVASLSHVVQGFARGMPAAVVVALHLPRQGRSELPEVLAHAGPLETRRAGTGDPLESGQIYVAPAGHDVIVERGRLRVTKGGVHSRFSPSIDSLFQSAAYEFGARTIGVILSGMLDDGAAGVASIKRAGGCVIVEAPSEAAFDPMPLAAIREVCVDHIVAADKIGPLICTLIDAARLPKWSRPSVHANAFAGAGRPPEVLSSGGPRGEALLAFTCPACRAVLASLSAEGRLSREKLGWDLTTVERMWTQAPPENAGEHGRESILEELERLVMLAQHFATHAQENGRHDIAASMRRAELGLTRRADTARRRKTAFASDVEHGRSL